MHHKKSKNMLINYRQVNVEQADGKTVLTGVDFHVAEGEFVYIIGRVGSGKSSLLKTFYNELDIYEAEEATVLGIDMMMLKRRDVPALRRQMGIVFQDFQLLPRLSVYKNLHFVLKATGWKGKDQIEGRISEVLDSVGMSDAATKMPYELSGGEQQRVAIARAILNGPKLIVADEPTANLDPETADGIMQLLRHISQTGTAVVMTTHNMPLLDRYPGIVYHCDDCHLTEETSDYNKMKIEDEQDNT